MQFVLIKPLTSIIEIILHKYDLCEDGVLKLKNGYFWISLINNISVTISLYSLVLFYKATHDRLQPFKPFFKFVCVKSILFFSYWQSCLFTFLQMAGVFNHKKAQEIYNLIICAEMVVAAVAQSIAFSYQPFVNVSSGKSNVFSSIGHVLTVNDVFEDAHNTFIKDLKVTQGDDRDDGRNSIYEETQMDLLMKRDKAFNWSDDDEKNLERGPVPKGTQEQRASHQNRAKTQGGAVPQLKNTNKKHNNSYGKLSDPEPPEFEIENG